jgi:biopolymer transport protein TolQ
MVGVLGTSFGIVESFHGFVGERSAILAHTASDLSAAIVPTALGILLAIVNYSVYRYFLSQVDSFRTELLKVEDQVLCHLRTRT